MVASKSFANLRLSPIHAKNARPSSAEVNSEANLTWVLAHDLDRDQHGLGDRLASISPVGEDPLDERKDAARSPQKRSAAVAILGVRRMRLDDEAAAVSTSASRLRPFTFLPRSWPTGWRCARPFAICHRERVFIRSKRPSWRQSANQQSSPMAASRSAADATGSPSA
jgi:hypothetical protein